MKSERGRRANPTIPIEIARMELSGFECEICDFCPLRAWKSKNQSNVYCQDVILRINNKFF